MTDWLGVPLGAIGAAARHAANACWSRALNMEERVAIAHLAIGEWIAAADEEPLHNRMVTVGVKAIDAVALHEVRAVGATSPTRHVTYWLDRSGDDSACDKLIDSIALQQVLDAMRPADREAVIALCIGGTIAAAGALLGISYGSSQRRLTTARRAALDLWGDGDVIPMRRDRRVESYSATTRTHCQRGHEVTPENTYRGGACRQCVLDRQAARRAGERLDGAA